MKTRTLDQATLTGVLRIVLFAMAAGLLGIGISPRPVLALEEGTHLHVAIANHPTNTAVVPKAPLTLDVTLTQHGAPGRVERFRVSDYSTVMTSTLSGYPGRATTTTKEHQISFGPCADCSVSFQITIPFQSWRTGQHELRWTADIRNTFEGNRQFTTSRAYVNVGGTANLHGRSGWLGGGGSWYEGEEYAIVVQRSSDATLRPGGLATFRVQDEADRGCAFLNPNAHGGSMGTQLTPCVGSGSLPDSSAGRSFTIPSSASDGDKLAVLAFDNEDQHAGVYVRQLDSTPGDTMWVEWQSWWNTDGLEVP